MRYLVKRAAILNIVANAFLFCVKITVGLMFFSISIIADALNSLSDIIAAIFIHFAVKVNDEKPDDTHQFGHSRAENIAGYTTGILMVILAITLFKVAIERAITDAYVEYSFWMLVVVGVTFLVKLGMYFYVKYVLKHSESPALRANLQDHFNDMIISIGVLIAVLSMLWGLYFVDAIVGIGIAFFILKSGIEIVRDNVGYLMGVPADDKIIEKIKHRVNALEFVEEIKVLKTQFLGNKIQVEIHVAFDKDMPLQKAHDCGNVVRKEIESIRDVNNCFVHIDTK